MAQIVDTTPYWIRTAALPSFPALDRDVSVDVAVVGGGMVGVTAAYLLKSSGLKVALIERDSYGEADTGHTTAHLTMVTDVPLSELVDDFGRSTAAAVWQAGRLAIDRIELNCQTEGIECAFERVPGFLHPAWEGPGMSPPQLRWQVNLAVELGFPAEYLEHIQPFGIPGGRFERQALFHPGRYLAGLLRRLPGNGSHVFASTNVDAIADDGTVRAGSHEVRSNYVIVATHVPLMGKTGLLSATVLQSKLALYSTYALGGPLPVGEVAHGLYWDTADPYHYLRVHRDGHGDYAIFGGADHKTGQTTNTAECWERLERTAKRIIPTFEPIDRWSGQVVETNDGLPYIGETAERQFVATGFGGNGITFGTFAAMMARDFVLGRKNPWRDLFDPHRMRVRTGAWNYVKENKDYAYYMLRDRLIARHGTSLESVVPGQGMVLNLEGRRVAVYRDPRGIVYRVSAICTHMGCEVNFNAGETTWDCPCHGSRFKVDGTIIAGPAEKPLDLIE